MRKRGVLSAAPAPNTAPIAARPAWGVSSETIAPSTANLRQQGVAESLLVLGGTLVDIAHNAHRTRAARDRPLLLSILSANPTPAFAGRWDFTSHKPRRDFFFHRARRILFDLSKRMGGAFHAAKRRNPAAMSRTPAAGRRIPVVKHHAPAACRTPPPVLFMSTKSPPPRRQQR